MIIKKQPKQIDMSKVVLEDLVATNIVYGLVRRWDETTGIFDYILVASLPVNKQNIEIKLDLELGRTLAAYWSESEIGTFLGKHNMDWILRHLKAGLDI